jgi:hypothetical protein
LLGLYWTSGTNEGYGCDLKHGWCGSNTLLTKEAPWKAAEPNNLLSERCILLDFATIGNLDLSDLPCSAAYKFICEVIFIDMLKKRNQKTNPDLIFQAPVPNCAPVCPTSCEKNVRCILYIKKNM